jgi:hypothetical protein
MGLKAIFAAAAPWRRILGGAVAALVLLPVPAMATLSFIGSWTPSTSVSGGPTPPKPTYSDNTSGQDDSLIVDLGNYQGATATANSSITLTRQFQITGVSTQQIQFDHSAIQQFAQAGENLSLKVEDATGKNVLFTPITFSYSNPSSNFATVLDNELYKTILGKGTYTLVVNVAYKTNNKLGGWKKKSAHQFDIEGL